jgi:hypothetical protein
MVISPLDGAVVSALKQTSFEATPNRQRDELFSQPLVNPLKLLQRRPRGPAPDRELRRGSSSMQSGHA